jgi:hypothetical protein
MPRPISLTPPVASVARYKNKKKMKDDGDFNMFMAMTSDETDTWVDSNTAADAETRRVLKIMLKALRVFSQQLED